jgi:hypothetical protein
LTADADNFCICDMDRGVSQVCVSTAAVAHRSYLRYFFLEAAVLSQISTRYTAPVHAACVAFHNRGLLLCGESGAGKSSLAYACARAGWTYTTDDAAYLLLDSPQLCVTGNCNQLRFRPNARKLFPELQHYQITPRAAGKPSMEVPVAHFPSLRVSQIAPVHLIIFLNRLRTGPPALRPTTIDRARLFMGQNYFGPPALCTLRNEATERLARTVPVLELSYSTLDDAVLHLEQYLGSAR